MDVTNEINSLIRLPFSEIKALPKNASKEVADSNGLRFQITTWCEQVAPAKYRVVISSHRMRSLGVSSLDAAEGFTIDAVGNIERLGREHSSNPVLPRLI